MGRYLLLMIGGLMVAFSTTTIVLDQSRVNRVKANAKAFAVSKARNMSTSGANMAVSKMSLEDSWDNGFANLTMGGANGHVWIEDPSSNSSLSASEKMIISVGSFDDVSETTMVTLRIPPDLGKYALYATGNVEKINTYNEFGFNDQSLIIKNAGALPAIDWDSLEMLALKQEAADGNGSHIINGSAEEDQDDTQDQGLKGGHFDVDVFDAPTNKERYHKHEFDDEFDVTYVDVANDPKLLFDEIIGAGYPHDLQLTFYNAGMGSGTFTFDAGNGVKTGFTQNGFNTVFDPGKLVQLRVDFVTLEDFRKTEPKMVQNDVANRDQAFSIRMFDTVSGTLVYELSVYHHVKKGDGDFDDDDGKGKHGPKGKDKDKHGPKGKDKDKHGPKGKDEDKHGPKGKDEDKNCGKSSFYFKDKEPNVTIVYGDLIISGNTTLYGIYIVHGNVIMNGNVHVEGIIAMPDPGSVIMHGGGNPKIMNVTGGVVVDANVKGTGNHVSVKYHPDYMKIFADYQKDSGMMITRWLESPVF